MQHMSVLDLFSVGPGPSSSHTVGPMKAARIFASELSHVDFIQVNLFGSLALTGKSHGTDLGICMGLEGELPEELDVDQAPKRLEKILSSKKISLLGQREILFSLKWNRRVSLPEHPNGMEFEALLDGQRVHHAVYFSIGGGFVAKRGESLQIDDIHHNYRFRNGADLLNICQKNQCRIEDVMLKNEEFFRVQKETYKQLLARWDAMKSAVEKGLRTEGILPGGLKLRRRAFDLQKAYTLKEKSGDHGLFLDRINMYALALSEENAAGGRVVTAPTNGAAGVLPAVLYEYVTTEKPDDLEECVVRFLLVSGAIGLLYKWNASISGAEVGCQGEVGVACSMAAAGLAALYGGTPEQIENAAEIGMEHNLGLTCDPVGGLVQVPCIERNAMGAVKAMNAARIAMQGDGQHVVSLDQVIATMRQTGADMKTRYKETSRGGLAVKVNLPEC
ncbi:MAG: L-serine ammonia-lyase [Oligoflexales bacterium]